MIFDRSFQQEILIALLKNYPDPNPDGLLALTDNEKKLIANCCYLQDHDLIRNISIVRLNDSYESLVEIEKATLTCKGIDFLLDDGGLSSILGTVTIKFHEDALKTLLVENLQQKNLLFFLH